MSVNGISNPYARVGIGTGLVREDRPRVETGHPPAGAVRTPAAPARTPSVTAPAQSALPAEAPAGTDPELWSVLSAEERSFFAKVGSMGPLTYGRIMTGGAQQLPDARGGRLDVRG